MNKATLCVVIPAFNEEKVIESSIESLKAVIDEKDIYLVSDGSSDLTAALARKNISNMMEYRQNCGKANALNRLITAYRLIDRYNYIMFFDADSQLFSNFIDEIGSCMEKLPACIVGTVISERHGLISAFRTYEYGFSHKIFKQAQDIMQVITVAPGCSSIYRSDIIPHLDFSNNTVTEDFDLTLQIHEKKLGKIVYIPKAKVLTQDPPTIKDYWRQVLRWQTGLWQNMMLHRMYLPSKKVYVEMWILVSDNLLTLICLGYVAFHLSVLIKVMMWSYFGLLGISSCVIISEKKIWALKYTPFFIIFYFINLAAFLVAFFRAILGRKKVLAWGKVARYTS